jgi:cell wall-associated NlpC family hydrolase
MQASIPADMHATVNTVLRELALDGRTCFTSFYARAPQGDAVVFECSDARVSDEVRRRLGGHGEGLPVRYVVLPDADDLPELYLANHSVVDVRKAPSHAAELVTQIIAGDTAVPLKIEGDWVLVRLNDGYVGWVRSWHLSATRRLDAERFLAAAASRVSANIIQVFEKPDETSTPVCDAVVGTVLHAKPAERRGWRGVTFADGRSGYTNAKGLKRIATRRRVSREGLVSTGMRFMGIPYLWGGTTPKGFDCSGLIQRVFSLHGVLLPRDSDQQAHYGRPKAVGSLDSLVTGDLLFFGKSENHISHVAMYVSDGLFLHAFGHVRMGALDPRHPLFEPNLERDWCLTRDPLKL